nr:MAG TPA: hypothetical protein [Bacteriophage sp.]DAW45147.1 MAG TPA: hypothetical protein [Bacteriophage sp.]
MNKLCSWVINKFINSSCCSLSNFSPVPSSF